MRTLDRRNFRFSMFQILLVVAIVAIIFAIVGNRWRNERAERALLDGKWQCEQQDGRRVILPGGKPLVIEFASDGYTVDPAHEPRWLDFKTAGGLSHAIYRWEGSKLHIVQASIGATRPVSFDQTDIEAEPGTKVRQISKTDYFLKRLPD